MVDIENKPATSHIAMMIDLETLGLENDCVILSGAYVIFDLLAEEFAVLKQNEMRLNIESQQNRKVDISTVNWHIQNTSPQALKINFSGVHNLSAFLTGLYFSYLQEKVETPWSKGADFDISILDHAYKSFPQMQVPWNYRTRRCFRTALEMAKENPALALSLEEKKPFADNPAFQHTALSDALNQAHELWWIYQFKRKNGLA